MGLAEKEKVIKVDGIREGKKIQRTIRDGSCNQKQERVKRIPEVGGIMC